MGTNGEAKVRFSLPNLRLMLKVEQPMQVAIKGKIMATQLEKQLRVEGGKYTTAQLARLKSAQDDGDFAKVKKLMDSRMSDSKSSTKAARTSGKTSSPKPRSSSSSAPKVVEKKPGDQHSTPRKASTGGPARYKATKSSTGGPARAGRKTSVAGSPTQSRSPSTSSSSTRVSTKNDSSPKRTSPAKPSGSTKSSTPYSNAKPMREVSSRNPAIKGKGTAKYTFQQWQKMTPAKRAELGLPKYESAARRKLGDK